jgi:hypothetical protein
MSRIALCLFLLMPVITSSASAQPVAVPRHTMAPEHDYWLSTGLNRLVFWQGAATPDKAKPRQN